jgi:hypothetical protein
MGPDPLFASLIGSLLSGNGMMRSGGDSDNVRGIPIDIKEVCRIIPFKFHHARCGRLAFCFITAQSCRNGMQKLAIETRSAWVCACRQRRPISLPQIYPVFPKIESR